MESKKKRDSIIIQKDSYLAHVNPENGSTQSVSEHLLGTMKLAEKNCPLEILNNIAISEALLHDAGKLSEAFYEYMENIRKNGEHAKRENLDHTSAGGRILEGIAGRKVLFEFLSTVIYSHHGLQDNINLETGETLFEKRREKEIDFKTILERYFEIVDKNLLIQYLSAAHKDLQSILRKIEFFVHNTSGNNCGSKEFYLGMFERMALSILMDSDWIDTACFWQGDMHPVRISEERMKKIWEVSIEHFENYMTHMSEIKEHSLLDVYRNEISDLCFKASKKEQRLYRLTVPTGAGKTLSSLRFALYHAKEFYKQHIIYVAPYNSILEQNAEDIRKAVGNEEFVLEHHSNIFYEDEKKESVYKKLTESWDCPFILTSAVQMLNTLFSGQKSNIRRMYNLCNSVIIFDEVQAFPLKGTELFNLAVNFLTEFCNTTVVLCSATQPSLATLKENNLYGCVEMVDAQKQYANAFKRVTIEDKTQMIAGGMSLDDLCEFIRDEFQIYGSVLAVVNTTKCAQKVYEKLKRYMNGECEIYHLSTRMCPRNRKDVLESIKCKLNPQNKQPLICVSTQLIEAGVNLSFGCVIRSVAGIDSIIQAAGRCNRHKEIESGKVYIVKLEQEAENTDRLYDIKRAQKATEKLLYYFRNNPEEFGDNLDSEKAVKAYYREYLRDYGMPPTKYPSHSCETTLEDLLGRNKVGRNLFGRRHKNREKPPCMCQAFATAGKEYKVIEEDAKVSVIIPYDEVAERAIAVLQGTYTTVAEQKNALRILQQYSVGISESLYKNLGRAIHKIETVAINILSIDYYDRKEGVLEEPRNRLLIY